MNVIIDLSKQIDILKDSDIFPEKEDEVIRVIPHFFRPVPYL